MVVAMIFNDRGWFTTKFHDASNRNRNAVWSADPASGAWVGGPNGSAFDFGSAGRYRFNAGSYPWVGSPTPCSVVCSIKFSSDASTGGVVAYGNSIPGMMLQRFSGNMYWEVNGTTNRVENVSGFTINQWLHVVGTYDGNILRLYKNGVQQAQSTRGAVDIVQQDNTFYINDNTLGTADDFIADYIYVYNRALTPGEIGMIRADPFAAFRERSVINIRPSSASSLPIPAFMHHYRQQHQL